MGCLCPLSVQPCCALLCSAVCCVQSSSVLWQQWQWRTESCCCRLQGGAHCALSESCTAQRIVVPPPQREPEFVPSKGYLTQHKGLLLSCPECPLRPLRELLYHHHHVGWDSKSSILKEHFKGLQCYCTLSMYCRAYRHRITVCTISRAPERIMSQ